MERKLKWSRIVAAMAAAGLALALGLMAIGCGEEAETTPTGPVGIVKGKAYVASGVDGFGYSIIDLETKQVETVNIAGALEPHGIIFDPAVTTLVADTKGRVTTGQPKVLYLGSSKDGLILKVDAATGQVMKTIMPPVGASLKVCGMELGPDGMIWVTSMGDGKAYPLNPETDTLGAGIGGGGVTTSICGIAWSSDGDFAYLSNMSNPNNPDEPGYVAKIEWPSGNLVKKIEGVTEAQPGKVVAHQAESTPDGRFLYVTDSGAGALVKIDLSTDAVIERIPLGTGKEIHSIVFEPDGKTAYLAVRAIPEASQSSLLVYDVGKDQVIDQIPGIPSGKVCGVILVMEA